MNTYTNTTRRAGEETDEELVGFSAYLPTKELGFDTWSGNKVLFGSVRFSLGSETWSL